ncbi:conserved hypothetical protein [Gluconacetobacter diazotrophicus PA1 5]|uniref:Uncharacterized protein n=2 Tax=Gluconacetobacter diazotrophicus TaxID=33996 RepID=A9HBI5_GLUDA|nr:hypothetical protein [Gluconacetobacter diazotrophicus]ACI50927.1 conserved hypothetical protein [Gluconacetobacter diazotrophicus PA1 5]MBB2156138.1 hypothetical protein [Gluconacetobacter diazotrophicus]TWB08618.1 hypothetical protein FBZ86_106116 [Gluconacetobacter diazotrophicus]CAP54818.1 conserved hypothetical protein [Gluconacetobacter diazotrophicus PA1 5]
MSYAALDAARVARACKVALSVLEANPETSEAHMRKTLMVQRIAALSEAAAESPAGGGVVTLTSEEFWLVSKNW